jgi:predicted  nucleic acid-binding Zn-ribbon protein
MKEWDYRETLRAAQQEFADLITQRKAIDERLVKLSKTIASIQGLLRGNSSRAEIALKFTDGCRYVLHGSRTPKTPREIRDDLIAIGFAVEEYQNVLASIHTTMKRLAQRGEVRSVKANGKTAYIATANLRSVAGLDLYW